MDSWASNEHKLNYKHVATSKEVKDELRANAEQVWKVDLSMNKLYQEKQVKNKGIIETIENIKKLDNIEIEGIYSHLASPDEEKDYTNKQISLFDNLLTKLSERNIEIKYKHILASTGITDYT